jgi:hypothetical protein
MPLENYEKGFVLTSNRDEAANRVAIPPKFYDEAGVKLLYPKDKEGGGSWIGLSEYSRLICLLNGAFENHQRKDSYKMSRGVVLKDLLCTQDLDSGIINYDLKDIEPFTIILVDWKVDLRFIELVWDGNQKHVRELEIKEHLWSSSPLYTPEMKLLRAEWYLEFLQNERSCPQRVWEFHHSGGIGDKNIDLIMDRGFVKTHAISQITKSNKTTFLYEDVLKNVLSREVFPKI